MSIYICVSLYWSLCFLCICLSLISNQIRALPCASRGHAIPHVKHKIRGTRLNKVRSIISPILCGWHIEPKKQGNKKSNVGMLFLKQPIRIGRLSERNFIVNYDLALLFRCWFIIIRNTFEKWINCCDKVFAKKILKCRIKYIHVLKME